MLRKRGFTLIELLVVIAIIGILASIVIASLNTAREKGNQTRIKANLKTVQSQSVLYYDDENQGYGVAGVAGAPTCTLDNVFMEDTAKLAIDGAVEVGTGNATCAIGGATAGSGQTWAVSVPYKDGSGSWCTDSAGYAGDSALKDTATGGNVDGGANVPAVCGP